jgi:hypothetical protein
MKFETSKLPTVKKVGCLFERSLNTLMPGTKAVQDALMTVKNENPKES